MLNCAAVNSQVYYSTSQEMSGYDVYHIPPYGPLLPTPLSFSNTRGRDTPDERWHRASYHKQPWANALPVHINDLPLVTTHSSLLLFADDTKCLKKITTPLDSMYLQQDLSAIDEWSKMSFDESKSTHLTFSKDTKMLQTADYTINDTHITNMESHP